MARTYPSRFPRVPYALIRFVVDRAHALADPETIRADMDRRIDATPSTTDRERQEIIRYALAHHAENRALYLSVTTGRIR